ncbi:hypothetical protein ACXJJ3_42070 (plasmid) [Kribbella sp. WER1]
MRQGRTLTKHLSLETRQYDLFDIDLGEGAPRKQLGLTIVAFIVWIAVLAPFLGFPNKYEALVYLLPPGVFAWVAWQDSPSHAGRRRRITEWLIQLRYALAGHRPVISLGARAATREEMIPLRERLPIEAVWDFLDFRQDPRTPWDRTRNRSDRQRLPAAAPIEFDQRVRLFDADQIAAARARFARRTSQGARS